MNEKEIKRLLKSDPKLIEYCIKRILSDREAARVIKEIYKCETEKKDGSDS